MVTPRRLEGDFWPPACIYGQFNQSKESTTALRNGFRLIICGGRDFTDAARLDAVLSAIHNGPRGPIAVVIHGAARGADEMAGAWAAAHGIAVDAYQANWEAEGRAAGPIRNRRMLDEGQPDLVIAFPGGRGTANMTKQARERGVEVIVEVIKVGQG